MIHLYTMKDFLTLNQLRVLTIKVEQNNNNNNNIGTLNVHELFWMLQCNFNASV